VWGATVLVCVDAAIACVATSVVPAPVFKQAGTDVLDLPTGAEGTG
jgi:hypothetical protein